MRVGLGFKGTTAAITTTRALFVLHFILIAN